MVRVHAIDLLSAFPTGVSQIEFDILEGEVDLRIDLFSELASRGVSAAYEQSLSV
jgi:hypothetical protein